MSLLAIRLELQRQVGESTTTPSVAIWQPAIRHELGTSRG
jgi:hypothetical protein